ncbi:hypothetical protein [Dactylosporangium sp. NPDC049140]|uniref:hypothetical protein n=1 Tax=Dactylosporangium sp. NPDC049140 TaxID=3155647 RepID=UPI0033F469BB
MKDATEVVTPVDVHPENLILTRSWWLELCESHYLRAAVAVVLKALHEAYSFEISVA